MILPKISLILNILVLIPVCSGILLNANWTVDSYGIETPARGILLSIYLAILIISIVLLFKFDAKMVMALLVVQIVYKLLSPIMAGTIANPVIISNLFIAAFHAVSVWKIAAAERMI
ncbi:MAG: hypothetical protein ACKOXH_01955 [Aquirufa sp.]|jgi:hypothetical protein